MKQLTAEQLEANWYKLRDLITESFEGERLEKLNEMYDYFEDRMILVGILYGFAVKWLYYQHIHPYSIISLHLLSIA